MNSEIYRFPEFQSSAESQAGEKRSTASFALGATSSEFRKIVVKAIHRPGGYPSELMARRGRRKTRRRRARSFSILGAIESYAYLSILTEGLFSATPTEWLFSPGNLTEASGKLTPAQTSSFFMTYPDMGGELYGANPLSLRDIMQDPGFAANAILGRGQANLVGMAMQAATVSVGMRLFKRLLRRPLSNIQRNHVKPALGAGVRLA